MKYTRDMLFKVLNDKQESMHGGHGVWMRGQRRVAKGPLTLCENGIHLCRASDLIHWLGPQIWVAKPYGSRIDGDDKIVVRGATLLHRVKTWNEKTARLFAADVAEQVLKDAKVTHPALFAAVNAARLFARGKITGESLSAAESAAWSATQNATQNAAWSAPRSEAESAAWSATQNAAWSAALRAARSAAWSAARSATESAAWSATWSAARNAQTIILFEYLNEIRT